MKLTHTAPTSPSAGLRFGGGPSADQLTKAQAAVVQAFQRRDIQTMIDMLLDQVKNGRSPLVYSTGYGRDQCDHRMPEVDRAAEAAILSMIKEKPQIRDSVISRIDARKYAAGYEPSDRFLQILRISKADEAILDSLVRKWGL